MKNIYFLTLLLSFSFVLLFSCKKKEPTQNLSIVLGENYYPLEVGKYIVYELDTIVWFQQQGTDCIFDKDTSHSFLKEEITKTYDDDEGNTNFVLERYVRFDLNEEWTIKDVWNITKSDAKIERVEENLRFIKLVFPVKDGIRWNGNAFVDSNISSSFNGNAIDFYDHWDRDYQYLNVDVPEQIGDLNFDSLATIVQTDNEISQQYNYRYSVEKYARNIGLVYKEMRILDTQCCSFHPDTLQPCLDLPWDERAERGIKLVQKVIEYN